MRKCSAVGASGVVGAGSRRGMRERADVVTPKNVAQGEALRRMVVTEATRINRKKC